MINEKDIRSFSLEELIEELTGLGEKKFRATQIFEWMHARGVDDTHTEFPCSYLINTLSTILPS